MPRDRAGRGGLSRAVVSAGPGPDPFTLPPGTFRIDRDGVWRHEGQEVTHPGVVRNLYANLRVDGEGHFLQVGPARIAVEVDDAPFVVTRVDVPDSVADPGGPLRIYLTDGTHEVLDPATIWIGPHETPYCRVMEGRFHARFSVAAWLQLARLVEEEPGSGRPILVMGARRLVLPRRG
jgi:uncharacterized protein